MALGMARRSWINWLNPIIANNPPNFGAASRAGVIKFSCVHQTKAIFFKYGMHCGALNSSLYFSTSSLTPLPPEGRFEGVVITIDEVKSRPLYLDPQATTPKDPRVLDAMLPYLTSFYGHHARSHAFDWESEQAVETPWKMPILNRAKPGGILENPMQYIIRSSIGIPPDMLRRLEYRIPPVPRNITPLEIPTQEGNTNKEIQDSPDNSRMEKQAARLIVIRRIKMNKHKLRKLRKKMKYVWAKQRLRRATKREKDFLNSKMELINAARKFDAKEYVAGIIKRAKEEPVPYKWNDPLMPEWFKEQEMKREAWEKRYQKMINLYLNKEISIDFKVKKKY